MQDPFVEIDRIRSTLVDDIRKLELLSNVKENKPIECLDEEETLFLEMYRKLSIQPSKAGRIAQLSC
jgi:hypothetical protein